jgi:purine-binding chemotaxis protein CheW
MQTSLQQTKAAVREEAQQEIGTQQFLRFAVGGDAYALRIESVREIIEVQQMTPLPLMPGFVRGVMNLRGAVVPVIDLASRLDLPSAAIGKRSCVVMVEVISPTDEATQVMGLLVDAVYEVFDAANADVEAVPRLGTRIDPNFIRCMVRARGQAIAELDLAQVLEQDVLAQLIQSHTTH